MINPIKRIAMIIYAYRYRRYWMRWGGIKGSPIQPNPFFNEEDAYLISKPIRDKEPK